MNHSSRHHPESLTKRELAVGVGIAAFIAAAVIAALSLLSTTASDARAAGGGGTQAGGGGSTGTEPSGKAVFPVRGKHSYGDGIGAGRGHDGQDVFAKCGTRLVAAEAGRIQTKASHSAAGNYVVVDLKGSKVDHVYMHLKRPSRLSRGDRVGAGRLLGKVGDTGNASGCHLHFEMWSGPGYYEGGSPLRSVTKYLRRLDRKS